MLVKAFHKISFLRNKMYLSCITHKLLRKVTKISIISRAIATTLQEPTTVQDQHYPTRSLLLQTSVQQVKIHALQKI